MSVTDAPPAAEPKPKPQKPSTRQPKVGDDVWYWCAASGDDSKLFPIPATLTFQHPNGAWDINAHRWSRLQGYRRVAYSDKPQQGCWGWPGKEAA
jgi:hypothetical protein